MILIPGADNLSVADNNKYVAEPVLKIGIESLLVNKFDIFMSSILQSRHIIIFTSIIGFFFPQPPLCPEGILMYAGV